jgi:hypothetical protein
VEIVGSNPCMGNDSEGPRFIASRGLNATSESRLALDDPNFDFLAATAVEKQILFVDAHGNIISNSQFLGLEAPAIADALTVYFWRRVGKVHKGPQSGSSCRFNSSSS